MLSSNKTLTFAVIVNITFYILHHTSFAQDPQFTQFYAAPMYLNPAFTGNTIQGRLSANYRKQWNKVPGAFTSYIFAYDHNVSSIKSGLGLMFLKDIAGAGGLRFTSVSGLYSYQLSINQKYAVRAGARVGYTMRTLNLGFFTFADQYIRDDPYASIEEIENKGISYLDIAAGILFYSQDYWIGASFDHLNKPNQSLVGIKSPLPVKYAVQGGTRVSISKNEKGASVTNIIMAANYKAQQKWDQVDLGAYYNYSAFIIGAWYRGIPLLKSYKKGYPNNDALAVMAGYKVQDFFSIGYSYDMTISKLGVATGGAHEISLIYEFAQPAYKRDAKKKSLMVPCTKF